MKRRFHTLRPLGLAAVGAAALGILGCSGASGSGEAPRLGYTNPASSGYQLVADPSSTATHVVLNLVGPAGAQLQGGTFALTADASKVTWSTTVAEGGALDLGSGVKLMKSKVDAESLQVAIYQKGTTAATLAAKPLFSVALDLKAGAKGAVALNASSAKILDASGATVTVPVAVGTLTAQ